jgi:hypothetical protein
MTRSRRNKRRDCKSRESIDSRSFAEYVGNQVKCVVPQLSRLAPHLSEAQQALFAATSPAWCARCPWLACSGCEDPPDVALNATPLTHHKEERAPAEPTRNQNSAGPKHLAQVLPLCRPRWLAVDFLGKPCRHTRLLPEAGFAHAQSGRNAVARQLHLRALHQSECRLSILPDST